MKSKWLKWLVLVAASVLAVFFTFAVIFLGAHFIEGLTNDTKVIVNWTWILELLGLLTAAMIIIAVIISWFKLRLGALLLTIFSILHIIIAFEPEIAWMQIFILPLGPLLFLRSISEKKGQPDSK